MKQIKQDGVALAFNTKAAENVTVIMRAAREWYFTFEALDPLSGQIETYALLTKRGELRTWADPRLLFAFLEENYSVTSGRFQLYEEHSNEKNGSHQQDSG